MVTSLGNWDGPGVDVERGKGLVKNIGDQVTATFIIALEIESTDSLITAEVGSDTKITDHIVLVGDGHSKCSDRPQDGSEESVTHSDCGSDWKGQ